MKFNTMRCTRYIMSLAISILFFTCDSETSSTSNLFVGRWELEEALKNGKNSDLLEGIYFEFFQDGSLKSNFNATGQEELSKYKIKGEEIQQSESELNLNFEVSEIKDTVLVLKTQLRGVNYQLLLKKRNQEG